MDNVIELLDGSKIDNAVFFRRIVQNPSFLEKVKQTEEICLRAVRINPSALRYVKNNTTKISTEAAKKDGLVIKYANNCLNYYTCLEAVRQNGCALQYVKNQTYDICVAAVKQNIKAFEYIDKDILDTMLNKL